MTEARPTGSTYGLENAVEQHMALCLELAVTSLELVTKEPPYSGQVVLLHELIKRVEVSAIALSAEAGSSWAVMAADFGVKRQSLNYRLSDRATDWLEATRNSDATTAATRSRIWRRHMLELRNMVQELLGGPEEGANIAAARERLKVRHLRAITSRSRRRQPPVMPTTDRS